VLDRVVALLEQDVRDEEDALLPRLQQALTPGELRSLGTQWALVRSIAPNTVPSDCVPPPAGQRSVRLAFGSAGPCARRGRSSPLS
jgi:hypothetical protein